MSSTLSYGKTLPERPQVVIDRALDVRVHVKWIPPTLSSVGFASSFAFCGSSDDEASAPQHGERFEISEDDYILELRMHPETYTQTSVAKITSYHHSRKVELVSGAYSTLSGDMHKPWLGKFAVFAERVAKSKLHPPASVGYRVCLYIHNDHILLGDYHDPAEEPGERLEAWRPDVDAAKIQVSMRINDDNVMAVMTYSIGVFSNIVMEMLEAEASVNNVWRVFENVVAANMYNYFQVDRVGALLTEYVSVNKYPSDGHVTRESNDHPYWLYPCMRIRAFARRYDPLSDDMLARVPIGELYFSLDEFGVVTVVEYEHKEGNVTGRYSNSVVYEYSDDAWKNAMSALSNLIVHSGRQRDDKHYVYLGLYWPNMAHEEGLTHVQWQRPSHKKRDITEEMLERTRRASREAAYDVLPVHQIELSFLQYRGIRVEELYLYVRTLAMWQVLFIMDHDSAGRRFATPFFMRDFPDELYSKKERANMHVQLGEAILKLTEGADSVDLAKLMKENPGHKVTYTRKTSIQLRKELEEKLEKAPYIVHARAEEVRIQIRWTKKMLTPLHSAAPRQGSSRRQARQQRHGAPRGSNEPASETYTRCATTMPTEDETVMTLVFRPSSVQGDSQMYYVYHGTDGTRWSRRRFRGSRGVRGDVKDVWYTEFGRFVNDIVWGSSVEQNIVPRIDVLIHDKQLGADSPASVLPDITRANVHVALQMTSADEFYLMLYALAVFGGNVMEMPATTATVNYVWLLLESALSEVYSARAQHMHLENTLVYNSVDRTRENTTHAPTRNHHPYAVATDVRIRVLRPSSGASRGNLMRRQMPVAEVVINMSAIRGLDLLIHKRSDAGAYIGSNILHYGYFDHNAILYALETLHTRADMADATTVEISLCRMRAKSIAGSEVNVNDASVYATLTADQLYDLEVPLHIPLSIEKLRTLHGPMLISNLIHEMWLKDIHTLLQSKEAGTTFTTRRGLRGLVRTEAAPEEWYERVKARFTRATTSSMACDVRSFISDRLVVSTQVSDPRKPDPPEPTPSSATSRPVRRGPQKRKKKKKGKMQYLEDDLQDELDAEYDSQYTDESPCVHEV